MEKEETKYQITLTESQLKLLSNALEDWCRFLSGQTELWHATSILDNYSECEELLKSLENLIGPGNGASYGWSGSTCENANQRKYIAMSYMIYREILHFFAIKENWNNVYNGPTLTCKEQGPMIVVKELTK